MQIFKVATMTGLAILSMNPDSEVDQMPPHRQTLDITNPNTFRSHLQQTTSRTMKSLAFDDPNQFFFTIFKPLVLKSADFCMFWSNVVDIFPPVFCMERQNYKANVDLFPSIQIFKADFEANRGSSRRRIKFNHLEPCYGINAPPLQFKAIPVT